VTCATNVLFRLTADGTSLSSVTQDLLDGPQGIAEFGGLLAVANANGNSLVAVNVSSGHAFELVSGGSGVLATPRGLAAFNGSLLVTNSASDTISVVMGTPTAPTVNVYLTSSLLVNARGLAVSTDQSQLFVAVEGTGRPYVLAGPTATRVLGVALYGNAPLALPAGLLFLPPLLYSVNQDALLRTDMTSMATTVVARPPPGVFAATKGLATALLGTQRVWFTLAGAAGAILIIDDASGNVFTYVNSSLLRCVRAGDVLYHPASSRLFVANSELGKLLVVTDSAGTITVAEFGSGPPNFVQPTGLALSPDGAALIVADRDAATNAVFRVALDSGAISIYFASPLLLGPAAVVFDATGRLVVFGSSSSVARVSTNLVDVDAVTNVSGLDVPASVRLDAEHERFFVTIPSEEQIFALNLTASPAGPGPSGDALKVGLGVGLGLGLALIVVVVVVVLRSRRKLPGRGPQSDGYDTMRL
jgi:DNA-binding beta-propeller fold protein YncE